MGCSKISRERISVNSGIAKNRPTARPKALTDCAPGTSSVTPTTEMLSVPTTGIIQAGVACTTCCRTLIHRLTTSHAKPSIDTVPITQRTMVSVAEYGATTAGRSRSAMIGVAKKLTATGWANSARTAAGDSMHLTP